MRGYFFGSGVIMALLYLMLSAFIIHWLGVQNTNYVATLVLGAGVLAGGTYALVMFVWLAAHVVGRLSRRQPIREIDD